MRDSDGNKLESSELRVSDETLCLINELWCDWQDPLASYDINDHDPDPQPRYDYNNENK